jgi:hypothetical protein
MTVVSALSKIVIPAKAVISPASRAVLDLHPDLGSQGM